MSRSEPEIFTQQRSSAIRVNNCWNGGCSTPLLASTRAMWSITYGTGMSSSIDAYDARSLASKWSTMCQPNSATRRTMRQYAPISGAPPRWATKLKRVPRTPASCSSAMSRSVNDSSIIATPAYRPRPRRSASAIAALSVPWQLACTKTARDNPSLACNASNLSMPESGGV